LVAIRNLFVAIGMNGKIRIKIIYQDGSVVYNKGRMNSIAALADLTESAVEKYHTFFMFYYESRYFWCKIRRLFITKEKFIFYHKRNLLCFHVKILLF